MRNSMYINIANAYRSLVIGDTVIDTYWYIKYRTTNINNKILIHCITSLKLFSNHLLLWRQVLIISDFLLNKLRSFNYFIMYNFSERHNLQKFNCVVDNTSVTMLRSITGDILASLSSHIYFDSSVVFLYLECLKSRVWLPKRFLKGVSVTLR